MAEINMTKVSGAAVVGAVHIWARTWDAANPQPGPMQKRANWVAVAALIGGLVGVAQNFQPELMEGVLLASVPMVEASLYQVVQSGMPGTLPAVGTQTSYTPALGRSAAPIAAERTSMKFSLVG